jgi:hypothetical protein
VWSGGNNGASWNARPIISGAAARKLYRAGLLIQSRVPFCWFLIYRRPKPHDKMIPFCQTRNWFAFVKWLSLDIHQCCTKTPFMHFHCQDGHIFTQFSYEFVCASFSIYKLEKEDWERFSSLDKWLIYLIWQKTFLTAKRWSQYSTLYSFNLEFLYNLQRCFEKEYKK